MTYSKCKWIALFFNCICVRVCDESWLFSELNLVNNLICFVVTWNFNFNLRFSHFKFSLKFQFVQLQVLSRRTFSEDEHSLEHFYEKKSKKFVNSTYFPWNCDYFCNWINSSPVKRTLSKAYNVQKHFKCLNMFGSKLNDLNQLDRI